MLRVIHPSHQHTPSLQAFYMQTPARCSAGICSPSNNATATMPTAMPAMAPVASPPPPPPLASTVLPLLLGDAGVLAGLKTRNNQRTIVTVHAE